MTMERFLQKERDEPSVKHKTMKKFVIIILLKYIVTFQVFK